MSSSGVTFNLTCGKGVTELQNLANLRLSSFAESHQMQQKNFAVSPNAPEIWCSACGEHWEDMVLLPTRSEEREVLGVGSIPVAILPSCQHIKTIVLSLHKHASSWIVKIRNTSEAVLRPQYTP